MLKPVNTLKENHLMRRILSLMLALSLIGGVASTAFAQTDTDKKKAKKKKGKKGTDTTEKKAQ